MTSMFKSPGCTESHLADTRISRIFATKKLPVGEPHERSQSHHNQYIIHTFMIFGAIHTGDNNSHPPVLVQKPLCHQFIHYHLRSIWVFGINHLKPRNFVVVAIECPFAIVDRGSIMSRIHRWSVMIYGSLQAEFMGDQVLRENHHASVVWNWYHWVAIAYLYQPSP